MVQHYRSLKFSTGVACTARVDTSEALAEGTGHYGYHFFFPLYILCGSGDTCRHVWKSRE
jgi:hypothetical protein